jgi:dTDP-4-dehydrorhamnose reductase
MRVAVIGATGQLGSDIARAFGAYHEVVALGHDAIEVADAGSVMTVLQGADPDVVVNCAAAHRVQDLESDHSSAFGVNAGGALNVARACRDTNAACVFISTDYVFDGGKLDPYDEDDVAEPINVYGVSKLAGEHLTRQACQRAYVVRLSSLFGIRGPRGKDGNFIEKILSRGAAGDPLQVVTDITMSPTYTLDAAVALESVITTMDPGTYHLSNAGSCSWYDLAKYVLSGAGLDVEVAPTSASSTAGGARIPAHSALTSVRTPAGIVPRPWQEAVDAYLSERANPARSQSTE